MCVETWLEKNKATIGKVLAMDYPHLPFVTLDLSKENKRLARVNLSDAQLFQKYISQVIEENNALWAIGKYAENRTIYDHSAVFSGSERRTLHLGVDLWVSPGTLVLAPLPGRVHSLANNATKGDYGPTLILEHNLGNLTFYTLYGHLNLASIAHLEVGKRCVTGEVIGTVGNFPDNGNWPPHLHFQIIKDLLGKKGDFFGVAPLSKKTYFLNLCPDPNLILQLPLR